MPEAARFRDRRLQNPDIQSLMPLRLAARQLLQFGPTFRRAKISDSVPVQLEMEKAFVR